MRLVSNDRNLRIRHSMRTENRKMISARRGAVGLAWVAMGFAAATMPLVGQQRVDYRKADFIRNASTFIGGRSIYPSWIEDSVRFWYTSSDRADRGTVYLVDPV